MFNSPRLFSISHWNVVGALHSPNSMCSHSKNPMFLAVKVVYCFEALHCNLSKLCPLSPSRKVPCVNQALNCFLYPLEWVIVLLGSCIQFMEVSAESIDFHPSCIPAKQYCTMGSGWGESSALLASLSCECEPHQP